MAVKRTRRRILREALQDTLLSLKLWHEDIRNPDKEVSDERTEQLALLLQNRLNRALHWDEDAQASTCSSALSYEEFNKRRTIRGSG